MRTLSKAAVVMLEGMASSHFLISETAQKGGRSRTLKDLAGGKVRRKLLDWGGK